LTKEKSITIDRNGAVKTENVEEQKIYKSIPVFPLFFQESIKTGSSITLVVFFSLRVKQRHTVAHKTMKGTFWCFLYQTRARFELFSVGSMRVEHVTLVVRDEPS
jgi:hypothetical protein